MVELLKKTFPQRFLLAKMTHLPLFGNLIDRLLFDGDDVLFLPKDQTISINQRLETEGSQVLPSQVLHHFIEKSNYHWIMDFCICRAGDKCRDYPIELGCLFLGEAVLGINPKLGRRVTRQQAHEHVRKCREAGLVHLIGRNKLDTIWLNIRPKEKLLTICSCCPCCCLWRILPELDDEIGHKVTRMPGASVRVTEGCTGCGSCTDDVCFVNALQLHHHKARINPDVCRGCGRCVEVCPEGAIEIVIEEADFIDKSINRLAPLVDLT